MERSSIVLYTQEEFSISLHKNTHAKGIYMVHIDGSNSKLYMQFEKILPSAQGMGIWNGRAYMLYDTGECAVYDLTTKNPVPIASFPLGSYNNGIPSKEYLNHANSCMFGTIHNEGNPTPLLYVTIGTGTGYDEDGYYCRCAVEDIREVKLENQITKFTAQTLQTISLRPEGYLKHDYLPPCWGCPSWLVDTERKELYIFSARYRTIRGQVPEGEHNQYIITTFSLPELSEGPFVTLTYDDIIDQFSVTSDIQFTQGGTVINHKIYYTYGCPRLGYPLSLAVFDLEEKNMCAFVENMDEAFANEEIECCSLYQGKLLCNTCDGSIYVVGDGKLPM